MRTFRQPFKRTLTVVLLLAFFSVSPVMAETAETKDKDHHAHNSLDWPGIYNGLTPCADCVGVKTTLALNKNSSYVLITQYLGKSEREFVEKGKFTWGDKANTIVLTPRKGTTSQQYFVGENVLIQLDKNGNRISGKEADRFILRRTDVTDKPPSHAGH
ncbi:copper resistance protein NlpE N-terminal domain-containing protein [Methylomonas sp. LL1]|uniref:copper resistance protein NlpE n=1 Tax=Methylomonas sp. LL1 TaxID=2785785 RepID=UPI0018C43511|nr:copper resistance protein NlpE [Methylomonas sp. LL1]QPK63005.1 copper resistance protein NlpE N-terminal domain-containing protein [Methylomonas sp. LL1]